MGPYSIIIILSELFWLFSQGTEILTPGHYIIFHKEIVD